MMDKRDEAFHKKLLATFNVEAREHLGAMSSGLIELEKAPAEKRTAIIETVYRESHSLKGAARSVNLPDIVSVCQSLENVFSALKRGELIAAPGLFDLLYQAIDCIGRLVSVEKAAAPQQQEANELVRRLEAAVSGAGARTPAQGPEQGGGGTRDERRETRDEKASIVTAGEASGGRPSSIVTGAPVPIAVVAAGETVRIATAKLDSLFLQAEELLSVKLATGQRATELREARESIKLWKKELARAGGRKASEGWETKDAGRKTRDEGRRPAERSERSALDRLNALMESLDGKLTALVRAADYDYRSFGTKVDNLLDNMKQVLMLPFSSLADVFPRLARDLSRDAGKSVDLTIDGGEIEIDRRILEEMKDPLMHLVRNCIDHGIETPPERGRKNKPPGGSIRVAVAARDSKIEIVVSDDGAGIDVTKIKASAVKQGVITREAADRLDEREALSLIFRSGISTSAIITDISGRGLGLAIVREKTEKLNGAVGVETRPDEGTTFRMVVPVTLATFRGVLVSAGGQTFVLPSTNVERVARVKQDEIRTVENRETLAVTGMAVSLSRLGDVLGVETASRAPLVAASFAQVAVLASGEKRMAFQADEVLQEQEVLVKTLGRQLSRVRNVSGATVLGSGKVVLILNVADLMKSAVKAPLPAAVRPAPGEQAGKKSVLIVEDSITSRTLLKNILETAGYDVTTAVDGVDAFTALRTSTFDLVVSDVQMPRMDGFELVAKVRADKKLSEMPVVLVTALESREDRERGIDVGANAYIVKSSFEQSNLLEVVRQLL